MSANQIYLLSYLFDELYGGIVKSVSCFILSNGNSSLNSIIKGTGLRKDCVCRALCCLLQHGFCTYSSKPNGELEYDIIVENCLLIPHYTAAVYAAKLLYGDPGELLIEELLHHGRVETNKLIETVTKRLAEAFEVSGGESYQSSKVREQMNALAQTHFIIRVVDKSTEEKEDDQESNLKFTLPPPENRKRKASEMLSNTAKRARIVDSDEESADNIPHSSVWWQVNMTRFLQYMRDQIIIDGIVKKIDKRAGEIVRAILRISEVKTHADATITQPISANDILSELPQDLMMSKPLLEQYLTVLTEDSTGFVCKAGESGGGMYSVHLLQTMQSLCRAHIESVVQERFGSKCLRIFRLLLLKKQLEQKQIEDLAMYPAKEAKEMLYRMFEAGFITLTEVSKTPDHAPSRTFYLSSVSLVSVARLLLEKSYRILTNLILRRGHEQKEHKRLLEKSARVDAIRAQLEQAGADEQQQQELEEMITPPERATLHRVKQTNIKLEQSELQLIHTMFVLETYIRYSHLPS